MHMAWDHLAEWGKHTARGFRLAFVRAPQIVPAPPLFVGLGQHVVNKALLPIYWLRLPCGLVRKKPSGEPILSSGADGGSRTRTGSPPQDFKSCVSTSSTTSARAARRRQATVPEIVGRGNAVLICRVPESRWSRRPANSPYPQRRRCHGAARRYPSSGGASSPRKTSASPGR